MDDEFDAKKELKRVLEAIQSYEAMRATVDHLRLSKGGPPEERGPLLRQVLKRRRDAAEHVATSMLLYQEAARARDAEGNAQLTATNLSISQSMKHWTVAIVVVTAIQAVTAVIQTYWSVKGCH
jgi:hypothetical protein